MLWDLGVGDTKNEAAVLEKMIEVEHSFNLVMIVERFQESLIFLKKELSWDYADVTSLKLNARVDEVRTKLNDSTKMLLKEFLRLDYLVYDHFYKPSDVPKNSINLTNLVYCSICNSSLYTKFKV